MSADIKKLLDDFVGVIQREERAVMENSYDGISRKMRAELDERYNTAEKALLDAITALEYRVSAAEQDARRWQAMWDALNGNRASMWSVYTGLRENRRLTPAVVLEHIDAALPEVKP